MIPAPPPGTPTGTSRVYWNIAPNLCVFEIVRSIP